MITVEDLAANNFLVEKEGPGEYTGRIFSSRGSYKIPHTFEKRKDGIYYINFARVKRMPLVVVIKALGLVKDEEIMQAISYDKQFDEVFLSGSHT